MKIFALLLLTTLASVAEGQTQTYFVNSVNERAVPCQNDPRLIAYKHVTDINVDQRAELQRIANGEPSRAPYVFPLCHNFAYNMSQEVLQVLLPGIVFACGYSGANDERCFLRFGENQVNIPSDFTSDVTFQGITFDSFSGISTKAYGAPGSKVIFNDVKWSEFANKAVGVEMRNPAGGTAMSAEVTDALYEGGDGGDMFINDGGTLAMTNVTIRRLQQIGRIGARAESIIATKNGGTSTLTKVSASESFLTVRNIGSKISVVFEYLTTYFGSFFCSPFPLLPFGVENNAHSERFHTNCLGCRH